MDVIDHVTNSSLETPDNTLLRRSLDRGSLYAVNVWEVLVGCFHNFIGVFQLPNWSAVTLHLRFLDLRLVFFCPLSVMGGLQKRSVGEHLLLLRETKSPNSGVLLDPGSSHPEALLGVLVSNFRTLRGNPKYGSGFPSPDHHSIFPWSPDHLLIIGES